MALTVYSFWLRLDVKSVTNDTFRIVRARCYEVGTPQTILRIGAFRVHASLFPLVAIAVARIAFLPAESSRKK